MNRSRSILAVAAALTLVAFGTVACSSTRSVAEQVDDASITAAVKTKLAADPIINPFNIDVDTLNGVVTLSGMVAKSDAKNEAARLARDTDGVLRVVNNIEVEGS
jgi:hyperosmotically inducible protein